MNRREFAARIAGAAVLAAVPAVAKTEKQGIPLYYLDGPRPGWTPLKVLPSVQPGDIYHLPAIRRPGEGFFTERYIIRGVGPAGVAYANYDGRVWRDA